VREKRRGFYQKAATGGKTNLWSKRSSRVEDLAKSLDAARFGSASGAVARKKKGRGARKRSIQLAALARHAMPAANGAAK
jgi:hypothetical protein